MGNLEYFEVAVNPINHSTSLQKFFLPESMEYINLVFHVFRDNS